ncbi:MAG: RusA family crossover junction endodeoxyribonuclease [Candidatus Kapaibacterium sp.]
MTPIQIRVHGKPQPAGSKRGFAFKRKTGGTGVAITDANPKSRDWKNTVSYEARAAYSGELLTCPIRLTLTFFLARPKHHSGTKGLKPSAPRHVTTKPDVLKLSRGVEDALTGIVWVDDSQIVSEHLYKFYGEKEFVDITIEEEL